MLRLIKDSVLGNIVLSDLEGRVLDMPVFNRLHHLMQNSLAYRVFPSNTTSRFEHSIGVMHIAGDLYCRGIANALPDTRKRFLDTAWETLLSPDDAGDAAEDHASPVLSNALPELVGRFIGPEFLNHQPGLGAICSHPRNLAAHMMLLQAVRLAALLHDVGHFPYSHLFEKAIRLIQGNGIPEDLKHCLDRIRTAVLSDAPSLKGTALHEQSGFLVARGILNLLTRQDPDNNMNPDNNMQDLSHGWIPGRITGVAIRILARKNGHSAPIDIVGALSELVSGDLDADRLDFILRDGRKTGVVDASGDVDRIRKMHCLVETGSGFRFCHAVQALNDIQQCLLDRIRLYKFLYRHHRVWRLENMLKQGIRFLLKYPGPVRDRFLELFSDLEGIGIATEPDPLKNALTNFSLKTDAWLWDLVRQSWSTHMSPDEQDTIQELFNCQKTWCSCWKRDFEYRDFLIMAARQWLSNDPNLIRRFCCYWDRTSDLKSKTNSDPLGELRRTAEKLNTVARMEPGTLDHDTLAWLGGLGIRALLDLFPTEFVNNNGIRDAIICPTHYEPGVQNLCLTNIKNHERQCYLFADLSGSMRYFERICERGIRFYLFVRRGRDIAGSLDDLIDKMGRLLNGLAFKNQDDSSVSDQATTCLQRGES